MLKVVKPVQEDLSQDSIIHDNLIVERTSKAGDQVFNLMLKEKQISLAAGFLGGTKVAFVSGDSLETLQDAVKAFNIKENTPIKGFRIVYNETVTPDENDRGFSPVPMMVEEDGKIVKKEREFLTFEGKTIYRKSYVVNSGSEEQDSLLQHDKVANAIPESAISDAKKTAVK